MKISIAPDIYGKWMLKSYSTNLEDHGAKILFPQLVNIYYCKLEAGTVVGPFVEIQRGVKIGRDCNIKSHSFICEGVIIGDNVFVGHGVIFTNDRHPRAGNSDPTLRKTIVEREAAIGSGAVILPGVTIGAGALVGAGSVVTKDVPPGCTVVGNPARPIEQEAKNELA